MGRKPRKDIGGIIVFQRSYNLYLGEAEALSDEAVSWTPPVDIYETDECYVMNAEIPGVESKDIRIEVSGSEFSIRGERRFDAVCSEENYQRLEGIRGRFHRTFSLPEALNNDEITANLKDGVLQLVLPKRVKSRKVDIQTPRDARGGGD